MTDAAFMHVIHGCSILEGQTLAELLGGRSMLQAMTMMLQLMNMVGRNAFENKYASIYI